MQSTLQPIKWAHAYTGANLLEYTQKIIMLSGSNIMDVEEMCRVRGKQISLRFYNKQQNLEIPLQ